MTKRCTEHLSQTIRNLVSTYAARGIPLSKIADGDCQNFLYEMLTEWVGEDWIHKEGDGFHTVSTIELTNGYCEGFNVDLINEHWGGFPEELHADIIAVLGHSSAMHDWLYVDGRHYDAEAPEGVTQFADLPFFQRWIKGIENDLHINPSVHDHILKPEPLPELPPDDSPVPY